MWSDNEADVDLLRFGYLAQAIVALIEQRHLLPITIGIFGDWGSGKSTVLKMSQARLENRPGTLCVKFNGWLFEGYEDAKTALMGTILDAVQERTASTKTLTEKGRDLLQKLLRRVDWFRLAAMAGRYAIPALMGLPQLSLIQLGQDIGRFAQRLPDMAAEGARQLDVDQARELLAEAPEGQDNIRRTIREFRADFGQLLKEASIDTLVVFIDDLDRCLPDNIIETLEAIKLFLFAPGTAFVIGADERLVEYAVRQRFPELPGTETAVGRDYLEKLIQVPLRLPPLSTAEVESYLGLLFAERDLGDEGFATVSAFVAQANIGDPSTSVFTLQAARTLFRDSALPASFEEDLDLVAQVGAILAPGLGGNPRRAKRFLNTLILRMQLSTARGLILQRRVLAKLMLLEYLKPEFFRQLAHLQAHQQGKPRELTALEQWLRADTAAAGQGQQDHSEVTSGTRSSAPRAENSNQPRRTAGASASRPADADRSALSSQELPATVQAWMADGWMQSWLLSAPPLTNVDLRPYFFIAHDQVGALEGAHLRLSPAAAEVLRRLIDGQEVTQGIGLGRVATLSPADATGVFESLTQQVRQAERLDARSPYTVLFKFVEKRPELLPQLVTFLGTLPESKLPASAPMLLETAAADTPSAVAARTVIDRWSHSTNELLRRAAGVALKRAPQ